MKLIQIHRGRSFGWTGGRSTHQICFRWPGARAPRSDRGSVRFIGQDGRRDAASACRFCRAGTSRTTRAPLRRAYTPKDVQCALNGVLAPRTGPSCVRPHELSKRVHAPEDARSRRHTILAPRTGPSRVRPHEFSKRACAPEDARSRRRTRPEDGTLMRTSSRVLDEGVRSRGRTFSTAYNTRPEDGTLMRTSSSVLDEGVRS